MIPFRQYPRMIPGALGDLWRRATNGAFTPISVPADYAAKETAGTPYRLGVVAGVPDYVATPTIVAAFVPTFIDVGETFTVPANKQALYAISIVCDGDLVINGDLVMVD